MTGSVLDIILIPVFIVPGLALWLGMVYWAAAHPDNRPRKGVPPLRSGAAYYRAAAAQNPPHAGQAPASHVTLAVTGPDAEEPRRMPAAAA